MSDNYKVRPSELLGIECVYTAYCFDKACLYIKNMITPSYDEKGKQVPGKTPIFPGERKRSVENNDALQMFMKYNNKKG